MLESVFLEFLSSFMVIMLINKFPVHLRTQKNPESSAFMLLLVLLARFVNFSEIPY